MKKCILHTSEQGVPDWRPALLKIFVLVHNCCETFTQMQQTTAYGTCEG